MGRGPMSEISAFIRGTMDFLLLPISFTSYTAVHSALQYERTQ